MARPLPATAPLCGRGHVKVWRDYPSRAAWICLECLRATSRSYRHTPKGRDARRAFVSAVRTETRGRTCRDCKRSDRKTLWSMKRDLCGACERRGIRNGFGPDGKAIFRSRMKSGRKRAS